VECNIIDREQRARNTQVYSQISPKLMDSRSNFISSYRKERPGGSWTESQMCIKLSIMLRETRMRSHYQQR
jgi:hypothetical protein